MMNSELPISVIEYLSYSENIRGLSKRSVDAYKVDLRMFFKYMVRKKVLKDSSVELADVDISGVDLDFISDISLADIYEFLNFLSRELGEGSAARSRKIVSIRMFYKYMTSKTNQLSYNPTLTLETPKAPKRLPVHMSLNESISLLESVDGPFKERDYAILTLFLNCGMRLTELVGINLRDIGDNTIIITGKGNKQRMVYLNEACIAALKDYLAVRPAYKHNVSDRDALFISKQNKRISPRMVQTLVTKYIDKSGLSNKNYSTHKLRHTAATLMYQEGGVDVRTLQEILGHAQLNTTQIYTHISDKQLQEASIKNPLSKHKKTDDKK